jgi:hypothetical protein
LQAGRGEACSGESCRTGTCFFLAIYRSID